MIKNKKVILSFLFLAWTIIFLHSIVPHHHHFDLGFVEKNHCHHEHHGTNGHYYSDSNVESEFHCCKHQDNEHACHFHVKVLTQVSIDNIFICTTENDLYNELTYIKTYYKSFYKGFISADFLKTNYLRGPPAIA